MASIRRAGYIGRVVDPAADRLQAQAAHEGVDQLGGHGVATFDSVASMEGARRGPRLWWDTTACC
ncbi:hypothetical protein EAO77_19885 [Streptomyces sp. t39]|nr:hypothetical protein EAO77_19885 [Streptomyces sp. t39]